MFSTYESAALQVLPIFDYGDERWWAYVHVPLFSVYFHVVVEFDGEEDDRLSKTVLYDQVSQVLRTHEESDIDITEVQVVLPFHMTEQERWSMEPLAEILVGLEPGLEHEQRAIVYVLENGRRLVDSALSTLEEELLNLTSVFVPNV